ncbi:hypothetical protein DL764_002595 [Monosporascus ibericus]|uniref:Uncharacterized protein n=1 Tax=Monosporascus ibericus TaxID=155417 RepID=A0A4Q4TNV6_9PEZI|nr:hypothetical protein DL764_002595 [Monosporascus ibericus]
MSTYYEFRMLNLPARYKLTENAWRMLKAYEDFKTSQINETELGRLIRLSAENRASIVDTLSKCLEVMTRDKKETQHCVAMMRSCTEMLSIAGFPFFTKLPPEVRVRIYKYYLQATEDYLSSGVILAHQKKSHCICPPHEPFISHRTFRKKAIPLAYASKMLREEVLQCFYQRHIFHFSCACDMGLRLAENFVLREAVQRIKFDWCGEKANEGISQLRRCPKLKVLTVVISKNTTRNVTKREEEFQKYFGPKRTTHLSEALGIEELLELRGLTDVYVEHVSKRKMDRRTDDEKASLSAILKAKLKQPREGE